MSKNKLLFGICIVASIIVNLFVSMKYPDVEVGFINFFVSIVFIVSFINYSIMSDQLRFRAVLYWLIPVVSSIIVFAFESSSLFKTESIIIDIISGIKYPLYVLFITPVFGLNWLFGLKVNSFALVFSFIYLIILLLALVKYKSNKPPKKNT